MHTTNTIWGLSSLSQESDVLKWISPSSAINIINIGTSRPNHEEQNECGTVTAASRVYCVQERMSERANKNEKRTECAWVLRALFA